MGEEVAYLDFPLAMTPELRPIFGYRVFETHLSFLHELHHCGGGSNHLGERSDIEDGGRIHG